MNYRNYITIEPNKRGGKPCVRGLRITVYEVLEYLASEMTEAEILDNFPDLTREDLKACIAYSMEEELEKKIGRIILSIYTTIKNFFIIFSGVSLFFFWFLAFFIVLISFIESALLFLFFIIEKLTGIDLKPFVDDFHEGTNIITMTVSNTFLAIIDFFLKTKIGIFMLVLIVLIVSFFEYRKKSCQTK